MSGTGCLSSTAASAEPIVGFIMDSFYDPLTNDPDSPLHLSPYYILASMPWSRTDSKPAFAQCGRHVNKGGMHGLTPPGAEQNTTHYCLLGRFYIFRKLKEMGAKGLAHQVLTPETMTDMEHFEFDMDTMTFTLIQKEDNSNSDMDKDDSDEGPDSFEDVPDPFGAANFTENVQIKKIGSVASQEARQVAMKTTPSRAALRPERQAATLMTTRTQMTRQ